MSAGSGRLFVIGLGPGAAEWVTPEATQALAEASDLVNGSYRVSARATGSETFSAAPFPELSMSLAEVWPT